MLVSENRYHMHTVMISDAKQEHAAIAAVDACPSVMIAKLCTDLAVSHAVLHSSCSIRLLELSLCIF